MARGPMARGPMARGPMDAMSRWTQCPDGRNVPMDAMSRWTQCPDGRNVPMDAMSRWPEPDGQRPNRLPRAVPRASVAFGAGASSVRRFLARPASESLTGAASVPSGTLLTLPSGLQASEQTGLDALRRIPGDPPRALGTAGGWLSRATALGFRRHSLSPAAVRVHQTGTSCRGGDGGHRRQGGGAQRKPPRRRRACRSGGPRPASGRHSIRL